MENTWSFFCLMPPPWGISHLGSFPIYRVPTKREGKGWIRLEWSEARPLGGHEDVKVIIMARHNTVAIWKDSTCASVFPICPFLVPIITTFALSRLPTADCQLPHLTDLLLSQNDSAENFNYLMLENGSRQGYFRHFIMKCLLQQTADLRRLVVLDSLAGPA